MRLPLYGSFRHKNYCSVMTALKTKRLYFFSLFFFFLFYFMCIIQRYNTNETTTEKKMRKKDAKNNNIHVKYRQKTKKRAKIRSVTITFVVDCIAYLSSAKGEFSEKLHCFHLLCLHIVCINIHFFLLLSACS